SDLPTQTANAADIRTALRRGTIVYDRDNSEKHGDYLAALKFFNNFHHVDELPAGAYPKYLVRFDANSTADVPKLVKFANDADLRVSVRSGGYQSAYTSVINVVDDRATKRKDFMLLDFGNLKRIVVDAANRRVTVQPGVTYRELWQETIKYGLHFPGPHAERVNVAGFALGGGFGYGSRSLGSGADNIDSVKIITSSNQGFQPITVDSKHHADLLYGVRGAGSFLGVVTELTLKLHPLVPKPPTTPSLNGTQVKVTQALSIFPASQAKTILDFYGNFDYNTAPTNLETEVVFSSDSDGNRQYILASRNYATTVSSATAAALQKITDFTNTIPNHLNLNNAIGYDSLQTSTSSQWEVPDLAYYAEDTFVPAPLPDGLKKALIDRWNVVPSPQSTIILNTGTWTPPGTALSALDFNHTYSLGKSRMDCL
ncbi:hypothetical protein BC938DRAFT_482058, partial [Jimgerdemannia flammicorona]